jgi:hypothetical protein
VDEFGYLSVLLSVILGLAGHPNPKRISRVIAVASAHSSLLASDWVGRLRTTSVFSELVVDVWNALPS